MNTSPSHRLLKRLRNELDLHISESAKIQRTYAGRYQKSAGAFSWYVDDSDLNRMGHIGSAETVGELLKAKKYTTYTLGGVTEIIGVYTHESK